ncbi:ELM2 and SANT domain-containing protein 1 [Thalassophryne amazonica]|uniref:ELM2 and SANT domain-containing protein 1 n=1 Tax=Thalassophryne amazonica TaxID=390379 RepID=UPI0014718597|nr:ELM2 and SANT domain-containing protein 1 [Thalassophryne amazonica]
MSVPTQQKPSNKRTGKRITFFNDPSAPMKDTSEHPEGSYYVQGSAASDHGQSEDAVSTASSNAEGTQMYLNSVIFSPEKGDQTRSHYQHTVPMKWTQQDSSQQQPSLSQQQRAASWTTMSNWGQNFPNYIRGVNETDSRTQFVKPMHDTSVLQPPNRAGDKQSLGVSLVVQAYSDAVKARGLEWDQQQPPQAFQETLKPGALNTQQHGTSNPGGSSVLQPFQLAFGQPRQHLPAYYQTFHGNRATLPNLNYSTQAKPTHQLQQLQKREQIHHHHQIIHQQIQQQQHQMHQQQMAHRLQQQQQQIQHEQQQQMQHEQQHQQKLQQHQIQQQQLQIQQMQHQQLQQQNPHVVNYFPSAKNAHPNPQPVVIHAEESSAPLPPKIQEPIIQDITPEPQQPLDPLQPSVQSELLPLPHTQPDSQQPLRRSRRLSKEGGAPSENTAVSSSNQVAPGLQGSQNGVRDIQAAPTGVIQSTRGKRRVSQEVNLETLAQKASEMESLPSHVIKEPHRPWSPTESEGVSANRPQDNSFLPLVIPVSVPVRRKEPSSPNRDEAALASARPPRSSYPEDLGCTDHKPSVIVTRRHSLRNSLTEGSDQNGRTEGEKDDDGKKSKRRPRPEPLFIPLPKPGLFVAPPVYPSITQYQSHLRSPVRLADNPLTVPPYTPPPILSPVREGSGLYFSTFPPAAAAAAAGSQGLPPPITPKSATRSLLRSNSCDVTPPILSAMSEATPVSIEPRINIGSRYQADVPELRPRSAVEQDRHQAELVWAPLNELEEKPDFQQKVEGLMHLACSSVLCGGGTNQELALHCLHECKGDIMGALSLLMLRNPVFPKSHHLSNYHYSGSDSWTATERRHFNKGIAAYKKDFLMVQKQVTTKTVAQCVEFYYTYKKHVKIGRSGTPIYGKADLFESRRLTRMTTRIRLCERCAVVNSQEFTFTLNDEAKCPVNELPQNSQRLEPQREEDGSKWEGSADRKTGCLPTRAAVPPPLESTDNPGTVLIMKAQEDAGKDQPTSRVIQPPQLPPPTSKPHYGGNAHKPSPPAGNKGGTNQEGAFPCKKCGRVFYKVKSRSAHMKSHAEQEKKAAAQRQKEAEERAAAKAAARLLPRPPPRPPPSWLHGSITGCGRFEGDSTNDNSSDGDIEDDEDWEGTKLLGNSPGSDSWTATERRHFNKGIAAYKKDFLMVQKQVTTKTVAQCVEFYYTYKKHVKIGRSGTPIYGKADLFESRTTDEDDHKDKQNSQRLEPQREEDGSKWEGSADRKQDVCPTRAAVPPPLESTDNPGTVLIMKAQEDAGKDQPTSRVIQPPQLPPPTSKPHYGGNAHKPSPPAGNKGGTNQEGAFPCKKCGRVFYKVKSRSAHMKSHAEQEKKAAAQRQKEAEERAAAKAAAEAAAEAAAKAAAVLAARQHNGMRQVEGDSTNDNSSDGDIEDDEDWE